MRANEWMNEWLSWAKGEGEGARLIKWPGGNDAQLGQQGGGLIRRRRQNENATNSWKYLNFPARKTDVKAIANAYLPISPLFFALMCTYPQLIQLQYHRRQRLQYLMKRIWTADHLLQKHPLYQLCYSATGQILLPFPIIMCTTYKVKYLGIRRHENELWGL